MNRFTATIVVVFSTAGLGILSWLAIAHEKSTKATQTRFEQESSFARAEIEKCLKSGNRRQIFSEYEYIFRRGYDRSGSLYIDRDGSRLSAYDLGDKTVVRFKSARVASPEELDLLEWCVKNPQLTWIRPEIR